MRLYNQNASIPTITAEISEDAAAFELSHQDTYIRQLDFIESNYDTKLQAASDYLRTKAETTERARKVLFAPQSLNDYYDRLKRKWRNSRDMLSTHVLFDTEKGQRLLAETSDYALDCRIQSCELPSFFGSGTLHSLANEPKECPSIGWHPKYEELLMAGGKTSG
jgi:hypothetical protein